jgi:hypothetical protein
LRLFNRQGTHEILQGEVAHVRTFPGSKRHKEAFGVISEQSASLMGFYQQEVMLF